MEGSASATTTTTFQIQSALDALQDQPTIKLQEHAHAKLPHSFMMGNASPVRLMKLGIRLSKHVSVSPLSSKSMEFVLAHSTLF